MTNEIKDLNPKNENYLRYKSKVQTLVSKKATELYKDKYFADEYQAVFIGATFLRLVANVVSAITLLLASYLAFNSLFGVWASLAIGIAFCIVFEVIKAYIWSITSKQILKYKRVSLVAILLLISIHLISLLGSSFGAWHLPTFLQPPSIAEPTIHTSQSIKATFLAQIAEIDKQLYNLQDKTSSSTIRKAIKNLTEQKNKLLDAQKLALEDAKLQEQEIVQEYKKRTEDAKIKHDEKVHQSQVSCLIGAIFFELVFILTSIFIAYYLFRQFIDEQSEQEQEQQQERQDNVSSTTNDTTNVIENTAGEKAPRNRVIVEGFKQKGKRQEASVQKLKYTKICALDSCKKPFIHNIHNQVYCTTDCRKLAYEKRKANKSF